MRPWVQSAAPQQRKMENLGRLHCYLTDDERSKVEIMVDRKGKKILYSRKVYIKVQSKTIAINLGLPQQKTTEVDRRK